MDATKIENNLTVVLQAGTNDVLWYQYGYSLKMVSELCGIESGLVTMVGDRPVPIDSRFKVDLMDIVLKYCRPNFAIRPASIQIAPEDKALKTNYYRLSNKALNELQSNYTNYSKDVGNIVVSKTAKLVDLMRLMYCWSIEVSHIECITRKTAYTGTIMEDLI